MSLLVRAGTKLVQWMGFKYIGWNSVGLHAYNNRRPIYGTSDAVQDIHGRAMILTPNAQERWKV